ncbi:hypothetical protein EVAR_36016_1 [Eumeta japonica]|uniref:Uncharacterized protein n=1 Tax=Eumeta variegata TaxID=151549 RepID=A0A4C1WSV5_EUMVA|nr:hypothetical protein EVAR_36016_1 [Eumeta japonica]
MLLLNIFLYEISKKHILIKINDNSTIPRRKSGGRSLIYLVVDCWCFTEYTECGHHGQRDQWVFNLGQIDHTLCASRSTLSHRLQQRLLPAANSQWIIMEDLKANSFNLKYLLLEKYTAAVV